MTWRIDLIIIAAAVVLAVAALVLWWWLPKREINRLRPMIFDPAARANAEDNIRKTIGQLFGGIAVLIGAWFAYQQFTQQHQASRDLLISNQVAKGFELLGNKDKDFIQRLGGIYALEGVMNTSEEYHKPVLEALSAFVRDGTKTVTGAEAPATDIQAALTVIGRRAAIGTGVADLTGAHIQQANLSKANLTNALLDDALLNNANLDNANLSGATLFRANLSGASLVNTNLSHAFLQSANLNGAVLSGANLERTNLIGASLREIYVEYTVGINLRGTNLTDANLARAHLEFADLRDANLSGAVMEEVNLSGADLTRAMIKQPELDDACGTNVKLDPGLTIKPCR
jgi:uncharacterized protein YjbI with pentapeptide repeats